MTHHATNLDLPSEAPITTGAGDVAEFVATGTNTAQCINYTRADGSAIKIKDESIDSDHYVDGSIDNAHLADDAVDSDELATGAVDNDHMAVNSIDSDQYVDGSIDGVHLAVGKDGALSLDGAPADHIAHGPQTNTFAAGYTTAQSDLVYLSAAGRWEIADADVTTAAAIHLLGIVMEVKDDGEAMNVALPGSFIQDASAFGFGSDIGKPLYMDTTDGGITVTKPTGSGDAVRTVGYAVHADMIYFNPSSDYVTLA